MFKEAFEKLDAKETAAILGQVQKDLDVPFHTAETTILAGDLPFYQDYRLLEIADHTVMPPRMRYVVHSPRHWIVLDFTNTSIYALNAAAPIKLNNSNIAEYIRFFFSFVKGRHGKFRIVESVDDISWKEDPPPQARKAISGMITPVTLVPSPRGEKGKYHCSTCMMFKNALFRSDVIVDEKGNVILGNEELQIDDMPVLDEALGQ